MQTKITQEEGDVCVWGGGKLAHTPKKTNPSEGV